MTNQAPNQSAISIKYTQIRYRKVDVIIWQCEHETVKYGFSIPGMTPVNYPYDTPEKATKTARKMIKDAIDVAIESKTYRVDATQFVS